MMRILIGCLIMSLSSVVFADVKPKVAVTGLAYEQQVKDYINVVDLKHKSQGKHNSESSYKKTEGTYTYIKQGELQYFLGDIKGEIKKSGLLDLIQGHPYSGDPEHDNVQDLIMRIEQGDFPGADYVLFGTLSDIQFSDSVMNIQHTNTYAKSLNLTIVADFSLVDTKTREIKAAFTALGEAKETRLVNSLDKKVVLDRAKLVRKVSKALGKNVASQITEQLTGKLPEEEYLPPVRNNVPVDIPPVVIKRK